MGKHHSRLILAGCVAIITAVAGQAAALCSDTRVSVVGDWGQARFRVEVADDAAERSQGLMNVAEMPDLAGMLFVYPEPQRTAFWMRNTLIPLDMLFADETGTITRIHENAIPMDETPIEGGDAVKFVLEINGGMSAKLGITEGDVLQHPLIGDLAALPCN